MGSGTLLREIEVDIGHMLFGLVVGLPLLDEGPHELGEVVDDGVVATDEFPQLGIDQIGAAEELGIRADEAGSRGVPFAEGALPDTPVDFVPEHAVGGGTKKGLGGVQGVFGKGQVHDRPGVGFLLVEPGEKVLDVLSQCVGVEFEAVEFVVDQLDAVVEQLETVGLFLEHFGTDEVLHDIESDEGRDGEAPQVLVDGPGNQQLVPDVDSFEEGGGQPGLVGHCPVVEVDGHEQGKVLDEVQEPLVLERGH